MGSGISRRDLASLDSAVEADFGFGQHQTCTGDYQCDFPAAVSGFLIDINTRCSRDLRFDERSYKQINKKITT